jgi:predicted glutamine amidotransferase
MCGIWGYFSPHQKVAPLDAIADVAKANQARGSDAHGFAWIDCNNRIHHFKRQGGISWEANTKRLSELKHPTCIIGHTRAATSGRPADNINNHPFPCDGGFLVHNGVVLNYSDLKTEHLLNSECDTEVIAALFSNAPPGDLINRMQYVASQLHGGFAVALLWARPRTLLLARRGNPLFFHYSDHDRDLVAFSSIESSLPATNPAEDGYKTSSMKDDTCLVLTAGKDRKIHCRSAPIPTKPTRPYTPIVFSYPTRSNTYGYGDYGARRTPYDWEDDDACSSFRFKSEESEPASKETPQAASVTPKPPRAKKKTKENDEYYRRYLSVPSFVDISTTTFPLWAHRSEGTSIRLTHLPISIREQFNKGAGMLLLSSVSIPRYAVAPAPHPECPPVLLNFSQHSVNYSTIASTFLLKERSEPLIYFKQRQYRFMLHLRHIVDRLSILLNGYCQLVSAPRRVHHLPRLELINFPERFVLDIDPLKPPYITDDFDPNTTVLHASAGQPLLPPPETPPCHSTTESQL